MNWVQILFEAVHILLRSHLLVKDINPSVLPQLVLGNQSRRRQTLNLIQQNSGLKLNLWHILPEVRIINRESHSLAMLSYRGNYYTVPRAHYPSIAWHKATRVLWCYDYRRRKWTWRYEFKSPTTLFVFHVVFLSSSYGWIVGQTVLFFLAQTAGAVEYTDCRTRPHNECPGYDTKQSHGEVPVILELWGMRSTPLSPLLPGPLWPGVVALDRALSMG